MKLDCNLMKIRDANMNLIKDNRFGQAIMQAKSYLLYILGPNRMDQVNQELDDFVEHLKELYANQKMNCHT